MSFKEQVKTLAKEVRKPALVNFPRRSVHTVRVNQFWAADLVEMEHVKNHNNNIKYLLNIIDLFSRFAWSFPLKSKTAKEVYEKFNSMTVYPEHLWVDQGSEFYNKYMNEWCEEHDVNMYSTHSGLKSVFIERFNRTMKEAFQQHFLEHLTGKYLQYLPVFMNDYNHTIHSATKQTPYDVFNGIKKSKEVVSNNPVETEKFKIGDYVRISKVKRTFEPGYTERFTHEVFQVAGVDGSDTPVMYELKDMAGEPIEGKFYEPELSKTSIPDFKVIDSVVKRKKEDNVDMVLVRYKGLPEKFDEWLKKSVYDAFMKEKKKLAPK